MHVLPQGPVRLLVTNASQRGVQSCMVVFEESWADGVATPIILERNYDIGSHKRNICTRFVRVCEA